MILDEQVHAIDKYTMTYQRRTRELTNSTASNVTLSPPRIWDLISPPPPSLSLSFCSGKRSALFGANRRAAEIATGMRL